MAELQISSSSVFLSNVLTAAAGGLFVGFMLRGQISTLPPSMSPVGRAPAIRPTPG